MQAANTEHVQGAHVPGVQAETASGKTNQKETEKQMTTALDDLNPYAFLDAQQPVEQPAKPKRAPKPANASKTLLRATQSKPEAASPAARQQMNAMIKEGVLKVNYHVGERFAYKHVLWAIVQVQYPLMVLERTATTDGFDFDGDAIRAGDVICYKSGYLTVRHVKGVYVAVEITGITEKLQQKIDQGKANKQLQQAGKGIRAKAKRRW